jgi:hypothetical protein
VTSSDQLKESLRQIFDTQIPNFGDYNLVFASNSHASTPTSPEPASGRPHQPRCYVIGYRWQPAEIVIAPFNADTLTADSVAVTINMTNLHHAIKLAGGDVEIGTSTGRTFRFGVRPDGGLPERGGERRDIDQVDDYEDFSTFIESFLAMA